MPLLIILAKLAQLGVMSYEFLEVFYLLVQLFALFRSHGLVRCNDFMQLLAFSIEGCENGVRGVSVWVLSLGGRRVAKRSYWLAPVP